MAELKEEQLRRAVSAYMYPGVPGNPPIEQRISAAAPYLQLPWDRPSEREVNLLSRLSTERIRWAILCQFIELRNSEIGSKEPISKDAQSIIDRTRGVTFTPDEYEAMDRAIRNATHGLVR